MGSGGLNERFSGGLFGNGTYLAEDIAKNDQYCTYDGQHGDHPELHKLLFDKLGLVHPGKLLYVFVCRVVLGHMIRTKNGQTDHDSSSQRSIWSSNGRELTRSSCCRGHPRWEGSADSSRLQRFCAILCMAFAASRTLGQICHGAGELEEDRDCSAAEAGCTTAYCGVNPAALVARIKCAAFPHAAMSQGSVQSSVYTQHFALIGLEQFTTQCFKQ